MTEVQEGAGAGPRHVYDAFVSYATVDRERVDAIVAGLEAHGLKCWIAPRDMRPGTEYGSEIIRGIRESRSLIVFLSPGSVTSRFVRAEVERAVTFGHSIYPVRLAEVELGAALEFFLSIHQWVDLFGREPSDTVKLLAAAIKSDASTDVVVEQVGKARKKRRNWLLAGSAALVALFGFALARVPGDNPAPEQAMGGVAQQYPGSMPRRNSTEYASLEEIRAEAWGDTFDSIAFRLGSEPKRMGSDRFLVEINGERAVPVEPSSTYRPERLESVMLLETGEAGEIIGRRDLTAEVTDQGIRSAIERLRQELEAGRVLKCSEYGCRISESALFWFCAASVEAADIVQAGRKEWAPLGIAEACDDRAAGQSAGLCLDHRDFSYPLAAGAGYQLRITFRGGRKEVLDVATGEVSRPGSSLFPGDGTPWVSLTPISSRNPKGPAPAARAALVPYLSSGAIVIDTGLGECAARHEGGGTDTGSAFLLDDDGKGLVAVRNEIVFRAQGNDPSAEYEAWRKVIGQGAEVGIALDPEQGQRLGPYWYRLDVRNTLKARLSSSGRPEVRCGLFNLSTHRACTPLHDWAWVGARRVAFGRDGDRLDTVYNIDYSLEDIFRPPCPPDARECKPFRFVFPPDWEEVYFQVTYADGKKGPVERHRF